ncbi:uncharacterized protein LOC116142190 isoform X4 [Pistacia vera]|uniref:uncharacterized protein LOC116142190 isoform X4 n=1 Tax=Pistacia vera TaxID=55513 RepID=UPI001262CC8D|nr:uncharacterized protein LOC116142190 isoform X4 [Pistacia vera]
MEDNNKTTATVSDESPAVNCGSALRLSCGEGSAASDDTEARMKRKRGRPRKHEHADMESQPLALVSSNFSVDFAAKRRRGRPKGSGKLQVLASLGGYFAETAGGNFSPYVLTVNTGEDIAGKVMSLLQRSPRAALCILSAAGMVSRGVISQPGSPNGVLNFEGCFEILSLSGSFSYGQAGGNRLAKGMLTISLAKPNGQVFGGVVNGSLIAGGPIQLIVATFKKNIAKEIKRRYSSDSSTAASRLGDSKMAGIPINNARMTDDDENPSTQTTTLLELAHKGVDTVIAENHHSSPASPQIVDENALQISDQETSQDMTIAENKIQSPTSLHNISENALQDLQPISERGTSPDSVTVENQISSPASPHNIALRPISDQETSTNTIITENQNLRPTSQHNVCKNPLEVLLVVSEKGTSSDGFTAEKQISSPASPQSDSENALHNLQPIPDQEISPYTTTAENQNSSSTSRHNVSENALQVLQPMSDKVTSPVSVVENPVSNPASPHTVGENHLQISQTLSDQETLPEMTTADNQNMSPSLQNVGENALQFQQSISYQKTSPITNIVENQNLSPISPHNVGDNTLLVQQSSDPNYLEDQNSTPASPHNGGVGKNMLRMWQPIFDQILSPEIN